MCAINSTPFDGSGLFRWCNKDGGKQGRKMERGHVGAVPDFGTSIPRESPLDASRIWSAGFVWF